jgi:hypothetical protein
MIEYADKSPRKAGQPPCDPYCGCEYYGKGCCLQFGPFPEGYKPKEPKQETSEDK